MSLGISLAIVAVLVGILTLDQLRGPGQEPRLTATVRREEVRQEGEAYYLPVEVTNGGDLAARDVRVQITLGPPAGGAEAGEPGEQPSSARTRGARAGAGRRRSSPVTSIRKCASRRGAWGLRPQRRKTSTPSLR